MYDFNYHRPKTIADAVAAFRNGSESRYLSGGQTLIPSLKHRLLQASDVVDLGAIPELSGIRVEGNRVVIGGRTPHAVVAASADVKRMIPALAALAEGIGDPQVRNVGTIGGSIANNDPAADYPAAVLGLNATVHTDRRQIAADDFFTGMFETALQEGEIITAVSFPAPEKAAYVKFPNPASRYAVVGVMVAKTDGGVRVAVTGAGPCVFRVPEMENALAGGLNADRLAGISVDPDDLNSDMHASNEYRAHLVGVMARRAVQALA